MPHIELFFLNISVRRDHLVADSMQEISAKQKDLKKKLKVSSGNKVTANVRFEDNKTLQVSFMGEPGLDMGGLTKEWFQLLIRKIFEPEHGMFVYHPHSRYGQIQAKPTYHAILIFYPNPKI